jgi:glycosyltransferase involved in cell wall biosynthesis
MRICFIATGDSIHSFRWIEFFAKQGHDIHWISLTPFIKAPISNIRTYEIAYENIEVIQIVKSIHPVKVILNRIQPDILHMHSAGRHGLLGALTRFHPCVATAWGSEILIAGKSLFKRPVIKFVLKKMDMLTCDAEHMRKAMQQLNIPENRINIIYFGTDIKKFIPTQKNSELLKSLDIVNAPVIISLRSLEPIYSIETLVKAIPHVLHENSKAVFIIAGRGSQSESLINLTYKLNIESNVRFVGEISNNLLPDYLNCADVYVSTSLSDAGLSASTAEAMACGLSVVVTDSGENNLWVKENKGGFIVPVQTPGALAEKIIYLLKSPLARSRFGQFNRSVIEEKNNYYTEMRKMEKIYESLAKQYGKI